jgi:hypothetical protein
MTPEDEHPTLPLTLAEVTRRAREVAETLGNHTPTVIAQGRGEAVMGQLQHLGETHQERCQQMFISGYILGNSGELKALEQVFLICEAWLSQVEPGSEMDVLPSQDPKRIEVLIISSFMVNTQMAQVVILEMVREADALVELRELSAPAVNPLASVDSPLLTAFIEGFRWGKMGNSISL